MKQLLEQNLFTIVYEVGGIGTFIYLSFFDGLVFNWWNWTLIFGTSFVMGAMWPFYWIHRLIFVNYLGWFGG